jgi:flagellar hook-length control protein FliK
MNVSIPASSDVPRQGGNSLQTDRAAPDNGADNPFAHLLRGQLENGDGANQQDVASPAMKATTVLTTQAAAPPLQNLPADGKTLPLLDSQKEDPATANAADGDLQLNPLVAVDVAILEPGQVPVPVQSEPADQVDRAPAALGVPMDASRSEEPGKVVLSSLADGAARASEDEAATETTGNVFREVASKEHAALRAAQTGLPRLEAGHHDASGVSTGPEGKQSPISHASVAMDSVLKPSGEQTARANVPVMNMNQPMGKPGWDSELGNRVVWMTRENVQSAQIRINPAHLGPIEVHVHARDALDAAIPRLREMMADNGLNLTDVDVSGHSLAEGRGHPERAPSSHMFGTQPGVIEDELVVENSLPVHSRRVGMVDYFA